MTLHSSVTGERPALVPEGSTLSAGTDQTVGARFAAVLARRREAVAIDDGNRAVSYAALDAYANAVAARLPTGDRVPPGTAAILTEDRVAALAAMLGVSRRGHAYVPLDSGDPEARLRFIVDDSRPFVLFADPAQAERARTLAGPSGAVVVLDRATLETPVEPATSRVCPDDLLYLLYTSGSTGRPKGVRQTHRNLIFFVDAYARTLEITADDRLSLLYTLSFSASNMDIYGALLQGARLCPYDLRRNGVSGLPHWLHDRRITVLHTVPSVLRELTRSLSGEAFPRLRAVDLGGENFFADDVARFRPHVGPGCVLVNHLAATEASVIAQHVITSRDPLPAGLVPTGAPPDGVAVRIVRDDGTACDADEIGHLVIESPYLSPGYWRRPELDARFEPVPGRPGWRRYLTEDLGRIDGAGLLHFAGRGGSRVKIRGHSIDPHEIEAALLSSNLVSEAAVIGIREPGKEAERLVACVVLAANTAPDPLPLRRALMDKLPAYMLPGAYVFLPELPRTVTGKVDPRALHDEVTRHKTDGPAYEAPVDDLERQVADLFSRVLAYAPVGRSDDFFLLGGDSMKLAELQLGLRDAFGRDVPDLLEQATVAHCAARLRESNGAESSGVARLVPLRPKGTRPPLYLVHGRLGQAFVSPPFVALLDDDQPLFAIQARGLDGLEAPARTIQEMAADYVHAIRRHQPQGPYLIGALCAGSYVALEMAELFVAAGQEVLPLLLFDPPRVGHPGTVEREELGQQITRRVAERRIAAQASRPSVLDAAVDVARSFELAFRRHTAKTFRGDAFLLVSRKRLATDWRGRTLSALFSGSVECMVVGKNHDEVLKPGNPMFRTLFRRCVSQIRSGARPSRNLTSASVYAFYASVRLRCSDWWWHVRWRSGF